jgi:hypothetical protein
MSHELFRVGMTLREDYLFRQCIGISHATSCYWFRKITRTMIKDYDAALCRADFSASGQSFVDRSRPTFASENAHPLCEECFDTGVDAEGLLSTKAQINKLPDPADLVEFAICVPARR